MAIATPVASAKIPYVLIRHNGLEAAVFREPLNKLSPFSARKT
jgi:hypothetical protein